MDLAGPAGVARRNRLAERASGGHFLRIREVSLRDLTSCTVVRSDLGSVCAILQKNWGLFAITGFVPHILEQRGRLGALRSRCDCLCWGVWTVDRMLVAGTLRCLLDDGSWVRTSGVTAGFQAYFNRNSH